MVGYCARLALAAISLVVVSLYPSGDMTNSYYFLVLGMTLLSSLVSTIMFVAQGSFFAKISDTSIGGTYLTLLNTITNLGGTWPKFFVLWAVDVFTVTECHLDNGTGACKVSQSIRGDVFLRRAITLTCTQE